MYALVFNCYKRRRNKNKWSLVKKIPLPRLDPYMLQDFKDMGNPGSVHPLQPGNVFEAQSNPLSVSLSRRKCW